MARVEIPLEGFQVDAGKAEAMADAIDATFRQADLANPTVADKLAALGIAAALVIARSKLRSKPEVATTALAPYILAQVASLSTRPG